MPIRYEAHEYNRILAQRQIARGEEVNIPRPNLPKHYTVSTKDPTAGQAAPADSNKRPRTSKARVPAGIVVERADGAADVAQQAAQGALEDDLDVERSINPLAVELQEIREDVARHVVAPAADFEAPQTPKAAQGRRRGVEPKA